MPDWDTHVKWALRLGVDREVAVFVNKLIDTPEEVLKHDPTELGELYRRDPEGIKKILVGHDWGRKDKTRLGILKDYCRLRFGERGVMSAELHHVLDYIAYLRDPEGLARLIIGSSIFHAINGKPLGERIELIRRYYRDGRYRKDLEKLINNILKLDYNAYKGIIVELVKIKAHKWEIHEEVLELVMKNLDEILADIDAYLRRKHKHVARPPSNNVLDKWLGKS